MDQLNPELYFDSWNYPCDSERTVVKILTDDKHVQELVDKLTLLSNERVVIYSVEATLPKIDRAENGKPQKFQVGRFFSISKEELYSDIEEPVHLTANFLLMVVLSAFIAGIGILKDSLAITIGAMVIAPFLGPNMALSFGTTLGDWGIIRRSLMTGFVGSLIVIAISVIWGWAASDISGISLDPAISYNDVLLAVFCGVAGVISVLSGQGSTMVGVMVAVALLPPLMKSGLLLGGGEPVAAVNSFLIFLANIIGVNITGIIVFYLAGIRPSFWWEKEKAKKKTRNALIAWSSILVILILTIVLIKSRTI